MVGEAPVPARGRKAKAQKYTAEKKVKDRLPDLIDNLFKLARGDCSHPVVEGYRLDGKLAFTKEFSETTAPCPNCHIPRSRFGFR